VFWRLRRLTLEGAYVAACRPIVVAVLWTAYAPLVD
jgi:hypothetical protein